MVLQNFNKIYIKICIAVLKNIDPYMKPIGRPNKYNYQFYLYHILNFIIPSDN